MFWALFNFRHIHHERNYMYPVFDVLRMLRVKSMVREWEASVGKESLRQKEQHNLDNSFTFTVLKAVMLFGINCEYFINVLYLPKKQNDIIAALFPIGQT